MTYEEKRNRLIPQAEVLANEAAGPAPPYRTGTTWERWATKWNSAFHQTMNMLWEHVQSREKRL